MLTKIPVSTTPEKSKLCQFLSGSRAETRSDNSRRGSGDCEFIAFEQAFVLRNHLTKCDTVPGSFLMYSSTVFQSKFASVGKLQSKIKLPASVTTGPFTTEMVVKKEGQMYTKALRIKTNDGDERVKLTHFFSAWRRVVFFSSPPNFFKTAAFISGALCE